MEVYYFVILLEMVKYAVSITCSVQLIDSKDFVGCYVDKYDRILPHSYVLKEGITGIDDEEDTDHHPDMENNRCFLYCKDQGFKYSGTQFNYQCFCGDGPFTGLHDEAAVSVNECKCACYGDQSQICGCMWRMVVHETGYHIEDDTANYSLVGNNMSLKLETSKDLTTEKGSELRCANICFISRACKVFVISMETGRCRLYNSYEVMCEGTQYAVGVKIYMME